MAFNVPNMFGQVGFFTPTAPRSTMAVISLEREFDAPPEVVRPMMEDVERFMAAGGFDEARVDGDTLTLINRLGFATIQLTLEVVDDPDAVVAYRQHEGIFDAMETRYTLEPANGGSRVTATTEFTLGGIPGTVLDSTIIKRQRTREIKGQFDYLEAALDDA